MIRKWFQWVLVGCGLLLAACTLNSYSSSCTTVSTPLTARCTITLSSLTSSLTEEISLEAAGRTPPVGMDFPILMTLTVEAGTIRASFTDANGQVQSVTAQAGESQTLQGDIQPILGEARVIFEAVGGEARGQAEVVVGG